MALETLELKAKIAADLQASDDTAERRAKNEMDTIKLHCIHVRGRGAKQQTVVIVVITHKDTGKGELCCHVTSHELI